MKPVVSIGTQDFKKLRENGSFYIDKTDFIREWWENSDDVTLITRPRRFGKTLNMSLLEYFFSVKYSGINIFNGLAIWNNEKYRKLQGSYPVIFLSFADIKADTYENARMGLINKLIELYSMYDFIKSSPRLTDKDTAYFAAVNNKINDSSAVLAIKYMSYYLYLYYGKKAIIILDEYDAPLQEAYVNGYWNEMVSFTRSLFNSSFKTNPYMERGIMTGITRTSKESVFSDLNNLEVVTTTSGKYKTAFGFTEEEVKESLDKFGLSGNMDKVKSWYNGFCFGGRKDIYNPWSVTKYLDSGKFKSYWANTSSNSLIGKVVREGTPEIKIAMEDLVNGKQIKTVIDEEIVFNQLGQDDSAVWGLLLASGYLKTDSVPENSSKDTEDTYNLSITNFEVKKMFQKMFKGWFQNVSTHYNGFIKALLTDDLDYMNKYMNQIALQTFSSFDTGLHPSDTAAPERFYHVFVLGLVAGLDGKYYITSNRESGFGRYDVMMEPLEAALPAFIFEFKVLDNPKEKTLEETVKSALKQIKEKDYDNMLIARGIPKEKIRHYGFAFEGKNVLIG